MQNHVKIHMAWHLSKMKNLIAQLLILLLTCCRSFGQSPDTTLSAIRPEIKRLVRQIAKDNVLKGPAVGEAGIRTEQWIRYERLEKAANDAELVSLTNNLNTVVRCYAFQALATRKADLFPIVLHHLTDNENVETIFGCLGSSEKVGDYFLDVVTPYYDSSKTFTLSTSQQNVIDSILIYNSDIKLYRRAQLFSVIKPDPKLYQLIREEAQKGNLPAAIALAKFHNTTDIDIIKNLFTIKEDEAYAIHCVIEFPSEAFYPLLIKVFENDWKEKYYSYPKWRALYQALANYPKFETYKLFDRTVKVRDEFKKQTLGTYLALALYKYPNPFFEPLKSDIKLDNYHLNELQQYKDMGK